MMISLCCRCTTSQILTLSTMSSNGWKRLIGIGQLTHTCWLRSSSCMLWSFATARTIVLVCVSSRYACENVNKLLVGNKSDLQDKRAVAQAEAKVIICLMYILASVRRSVRNGVPRMVCVGICRRARCAVFGNQCKKFDQCRGCVYDNGTRNQKQVNRT